MKSRSPARAWKRCLRSLLLGHSTEESGTATASNRPSQLREPSGTRRDSYVNLICCLLSLTSVSLLENRLCMAKLLLDSCPGHRTSSFFCSMPFADVPFFVELPFHRSPYGRIPSQIQRVQSLVGIRSVDPVSATSGCKA